MNVDPPLDPEVWPSHLRWWIEARFGMSLHLGPYSVAGRGEWVRSVERLSVAEYQRYVDDFVPEPGWAVQWAAAARKAGARYAVLTTKHHDGFCLFDSALTDYTAPRSAAGRDLVAEWVEAVRGEGLAVGLYYSLVDWHHPDYPAWGDRQHPLRDDPDSRQRDERCEWSRYVEYLHGQLLELCSNYGRIDLLVVDFSYGDYRDEKWGSEVIQKRIRQLQPSILFNDRWGREPRKRIPRPAWAGDFEQTEQNLPREGLRDQSGSPMPWEGWFTLTNAWSHSNTDRAWKSSRAIVRALVNCVSKNGNLLLNSSPTARGYLEAEASQILSEVGAWLSRNGESIYGAYAAGLPKPEWGRFTRRGNFLYAHILDEPIGHVSLPGLRGKLCDGRLVATSAEVVLCDFWNPEVQTFDEPDDTFFNFAHPVAWTYPLPDPLDTVVRFREVVP
ncbi:MAG: alpha-L-fucosidase [Verrucomicrobiia bacterium]